MNTTTVYEFMDENIDDVIDLNNLNDLEIEEVIPEVDTYTISAMTISTDFFSSDIAPTLQQLAGNSKELITYAENLHSILNQKGYVKYSCESRKEIERSLRIFIHQIVKSTKESLLKQFEEQRIEESKIASIQNTLSLTASQLTATQEKLQVTEHKTTEYEQIISDLKSELSGLHSEYETLFQEKTGLLQKLNQMKREHDSVISNMKGKYDSLEEKCRDLQDQIKLGNFAKGRLETQLESANEEISTAQSELFIAKSKINSKSEKIEQLKSKCQQALIEKEKLDSENHTLTIKQNELLEKLEQLENKIAQMSPEHNQKLQEEADQLRTALTNLSELCEAQSNDLVSLQQKQHDSTELLQKQFDLINQYDIEVSSLKDENESLQTQLDSSNSTMQSLKQQLEENKSLVSNGESVTKLQSLLTPRFGERNILDVVKGLLDGSTNDEMKSQNIRLIGLIENLLRFLSKIVNTGEIQMMLISSDTKSRELRNEFAFKDDILIEIARCRQFISQYGLDTKEGPKQENIIAQFARLSSSDSSQDRELFEIISSLSLQMSIMKKMCEKLTYENSAIVSQLEQVAEIVNFDVESNEDLVHAVTEKLFNFQEFSKKLADIVEDDFDPQSFDSVLSFLLLFVGNAASILHEFDTKVRESYSYDGLLADMPDFVIDTFEKLSRAAQEAEELEVENIRQQLNELRNEFMEEKENSSNYIEQLENEAKTKDAAIEQLTDENQTLTKELEQAKSEVSDLAQRNTDIETKNAKFVENYQELEQDVDRLRGENKQIVELMDQKAKSFDERLDRLLKEERAQHEKDLKRTETRLQKKEEKIKEEIKEKNEKIAQLKNKLKEVITSYESAFKKQKEVTQVLRQQNELLAEKASKTSESPGKTKEIEQLRAELKSSNAEKQMLQMRLKQSKENLDNLQSIRDNFWAAQISQRESGFNRTLNETVSKAEKRMNDLYDQLLMLVTPLAPKANKDNILDSVQDIIEKLSDYESKQKTKNNENNIDQQTQIKTIQALQEWDRWGRDLFINVTDGEIPCQSCKDLRYILGEMILASIGHRKLIWRLESLRIQKKALQLGYTKQKYYDSSQITFSSVLLSVVTAVRMMRRSGHYPTLYVQNLSE